MIRPAVAALAAMLALVARADAPVAFVADLRGSVTIEGDGALAFLAELAPGTRLFLGSGSAVAVTYGASGSEFTFAGPGEYRIGEREVVAEKGARPRVRTVAALPDPGVVTRVSRTATASLRMRGLTEARGRPSALEYPVDTRVTTLRPVLRWKGEGAAGITTVRVLDADGREIWKRDAGSPSLQAPQRLAPATAYRWTVMTSRGLLGEARFETLPAPVIAKFEKSRAAAKTFSQRVALALLLQDIGATQEAREAWIALARERPDLELLAALSR